MLPEVDEGDDAKDDGQGLIKPIPEEEEEREEEREGGGEEATIISSPCITNCIIVLPCSCKGGRRWGERGERGVRNKEKKGPAVPSARHTQTTDKRHTHTGGSGADCRRLAPTLRTIEGAAPCRKGLTLAASASAPGRPPPWAVSVSSCSNNSSGLELSGALKGIGLRARPLRPIPLAGEAGDAAYGEAPAPAPPPP